MSVANYGDCEIGDGDGDIGDGDIGDGDGDGDIGGDGDTLGEECGGVRLTITDRRALRSVDVGLAIAAALARLYPGKFPVDEIAPLLRHRATLEAIRAGRLPHAE